MNRDLTVFSDIGHIGDAMDPQAYSDLCFPSDRAAEYLGRWIARGTASRNVLLYGPPGSGKTRAAIILAKARTRDLDANWMPIKYVECETGTFDRLLQGLKSEANAFQSLENSEWETVVILDEVDNFRPEQQKQLKKVMERKDLTFVLLTNHLERMDRGLRNRCFEMSWHIPEPQRCLPRLQYCASKMGIAPVSAETLAARVYTTDGWRQMLRNLDLVNSRD